MKQQKIFITDLGENLASQLPRYGVWSSDNPRNKPNVIDTSDDVEYLKRKYRIKEVHAIRQHKAP